jgi:hypothetical protein
MKLLILGVVLLVGAVATLTFSNFDPAALFIVGCGCVFLGFINLLTPSYSRGAPVSAGDTRESIDLIRDVRNHQ